MQSIQESQTEVIWIGKQDPLPNTCCVCGLYTDNRVTVKHVDIVTKRGGSGESWGTVVLALVIHVALGPVGWLLSALMDGDDPEATKLVKQKSKIKIPQCALCYGMKPPEALESNADSLSFQVHPRFKQRLEELRQEIENQE
jgi:hypothetical protein